MKTVAFSVLFALISLVSSAQTDSTRANQIISSVLSLDAKRFSSNIDRYAPTSLAVNDCQNQLDYTPVETIIDPLRAANETFRLIKEELGNSFTLTWAECVSFEYYKDTPIAIIVILQNTDGKRIKLNLFVTRDYKIRDITLYQNTCNHF